MNDDGAVKLKSAAPWRQKLLPQIKLPPNEVGRERGQAVVRVTIAFVVLSYLVIANYPIRVSEMPSWMLFNLCFIAFAVINALLVFNDSKSSIPRRIIANTLDASAISFMMVSVGTKAIPFFGLYLWITLGNGFRFGVPSMVISAFLSVVGFAAVIHWSDVWHADRPISWAIFALLIGVPLYAAHFIRQRNKTPTEPEQPRPAEQPLERSPEKAPPMKSRVRLKRHDELGREQGQAIVRVVIVSFLLIYLTVSHVPLDFSAGIPGWFAVTTAFLAFSIIASVHAFRDTKTSIPRRTATNIGDMATISYLMISAGQAGVPFFVLYLWVTLGNGFRFGLTSLGVSTVLSLTGFGIVFLTSPVWQAQPTLAAGVFAGLIMIPGYTAHLIKQLHEARRRAEEASAAKSEFLARMSHELRTPLNGILGASDLLEVSRRLSHEQRALLDVIRDSAHVSLKQISNVLDFSKIEAGKLNMEKVPFDLHEIVRLAADMVRPSTAQKQLRFIVRIAPEVPYELIGDPQRLRDVLLNLLSNAVKFTEKGSVYLEVNAQEVTERTAVLSFEVRDTGVGISPEAVPHIFDAFTQEDVSTTRRFGGTGLGTTIAKQLVDIMGGKIGVQSVKEQGSLFWFDVPFERRTSTPDMALPNARAMIISDNADTVAYYSALLTKLQTQQVRAGSSEEAIAAITRSLHVGNSIHAILVDGELALRTDGEHRFDYLCRKANLANIPLVLVTDNPTSAARLRDWGYASVLPRLATLPLLYTTLRASSGSQTTAGTGVVKVAPWLWSRREGGGKTRLLVADDNHTNLMIIKRILEQAGFDVDAKSTGQEALDALVDGGYRLAILDMHMPELDGLGVLRRYRLASGRNRIPVIILTANVSMQAQQESAEAGADAYLSKPVRSDNLLCEVERLLKDVEIQKLPSEDNDGERTEVPVLEIDVLADLDRLYHDPHELSRVIQEYEKEGTALLAKLADAATARNHPAFCDLVHALKGNAANVGAAKLMQACNETESASVLEFRARSDQMLTKMQSAFAESTQALHNLVRTGKPADSAGETAGNS